MRRLIALCLILMGLGIPKIVAQTVQIDTITVSRNWRTKDQIILRELQLPSSGEIRYNDIDQAVKRIWDMGNFAQVKYKLDTLRNGQVRLQVQARDVFNVVPIVSVNGNRQDYDISLGVNDHNLLGKNINFLGKYRFGTQGESGALALGIPRQLLYKNLSLKPEISFGNTKQYRYRNDSIVAGMGYRNWIFNLSIGNPFHTDHKYTFSPNLNIRLFRYETDHALLDHEVPYFEPNRLQYLHLTLGESIGKVFRRKHRKEGYSVGLSYAYGLGLSESSKDFHQLDFGAEFHERLNWLMQFSSRFSSGFTTAESPSLHYYQGGSAIKGLRTGQIAGKGYYTSYVGLHLTYLDSQWLAIENKFFLNAGQGADELKELYTIKPFASVGTGVRIMVPMIPWLYINLYFSYSGKDRDWFFLEF